MPTRPKSRRPAVKPLTAPAAADLIGVGVRQLRRLVQSGRLTKSDPRGFTAEDIAKYIRTRLQGPLVGSEVRLAKSRAERAQRLLAEILAGQIPKAILARDLAAWFTHIAGIFNDISDSVADALAAAPTPGECAEILESAVHAALEIAATPIGATAPIIPARNNVADLPPLTLRDWTQATAEARSAVIDANERVQTGVDVLVAVEEAKVVDALMACRSRLLALPVTVAPLLSVEDDPQICREIVAQRVAEACAELSA